MNILDRNVLKGTEMNFAKRLNEMLCVTRISRAYKLRTFSNNNNNNDNDNKDALNARNVQKYKKKNISNVSTLDAR